MPNTPASQSTASQRMIETAPQSQRNATATDRAKPANLMQTERP